jgi:hypothetical protein
VRGSPPDARAEPAALQADRLRNTWLCELAEPGAAGVASF